jgi:hypothetical protein
LLLFRFCDNEGNFSPWVNKELNKEKALSLSCHDFFIVDKEFEIPNLSLIGDIVGIIKLKEILFVGSKD